MDRNTITKSIKNRLTVPHVFSDTGSSYEDAITNFYGLLACCFCIMFLTFYAWKTCLLERHGAEMPFD